MERTCVSCRYFTDGHYSRTYISPICIAHGGDEATFMRDYICGIDEARLYEPCESHQASADTVPSGRRLEQAT